MIKVENFPNAYKEVYEILKKIDKEEVKLIPETFINMIKNNMNDDYEFKIDANIGFDKQKILKETKIVFAYIYLNYWGNDEEKSRIKTKFQQDIIKKEKVKPKYNQNEFFKIRNTNNTSLNMIKEENNALINYKRKKIFLKLVNMLKNIFIIRKKNRNTKGKKRKNG